MLNILLLFEESIFPKQFHDDLARDSCFLAFNLRSADAHLRVFVYDGLEFQVMGLSHVPVYLAVRGSDAQSSGTEIFFHRVISNNFYCERSSNEINFVSFSDILLIANVVRMDSNGCVAQFGFGSGGRNRDREVLGIFECVKLRVAFLVNYLVVGDGCLALGVPINHLKIAVDKSRIIHFFKSSFDGRISFFIQGEGLAVPIHGSAHLFDLIYDGVVAFFRKLVYSL